MRKPQIGGKLVGRSLHPPSLQQSQQHDDPDYEDNAHDGHRGEDLGQGISTLILANAEDFLPGRYHDLFVGATTNVL
jgi:hypothetical protein